MESAMDDYVEFDAKRIRGENKEILSAEKADWMLSCMTPPIHPNVELAIRSSIGKEDVDTGSIPAYAAIAAGTTLLAMHKGDLTVLPSDSRTPVIANYKPTPAELGRAETVVRSILNNVELCRECGSPWKKKVSDLAEALRTALA